MTLANSSGFNLQRIPQSHFYNGNISSPTLITAPFCGIEDQSHEMGMARAIQDFPSDGMFLGRKISHVELLYPGKKPLVMSVSDILYFKNRNITLPQLHQLLDIHYNVSNMIKIAEKFPDKEGEELGEAILASKTPRSMIQTAGDYLMKIPGFLSSLQSYAIERIEQEEVNTVCVNQRIEEEWSQVQVSDGSYCESIQYEEPLIRACLREETINLSNSIGHSIDEQVDPKNF